MGRQRAFAERALPPSPHRRTCACRRRTGSPFASGAHVLLGPSRARKRLRTRGETGEAAPPLFIPHPLPKGAAVPVLSLELTVTRLAGSGGRLVSSGRPRSFRARHLGRPTEAPASAAKGAQGKPCLPPTGPKQAPPPPPPPLRRRQSSVLPGVPPPRSRSRSPAAGAFPSRPPVPTPRGNVTFLPGLLSLASIAAASSPPAGKASPLCAGPLVEEVRQARSGAGTADPS